MYRNNKKTILVVTVIFIFSFFTSLFVNPANAETSTASTIDSMESLTFNEDFSDFTNPERGWSRIYYSNDILGFDKLKSQGISLVLLEVDLKVFINKPISSKKLSEINNAFSQARKNGLKIIFRAAYDFEGVKNCEPKDINIITNHIIQLRDVFNKNEDVLFCVQAGFLGAWGEWHSSYYGNGEEPSLEARKTVLFALLDAVPKSRMIQVRRPMFIRDIFDGKAINEAIAFSGSNLARIGYHNDAVLSTEDDYGTYVDQSFNRQDELDWANNHDKYTVFGGETNYLSSKSDSNNAVNEFEKLHLQYLNPDYHPDVISKWKNTSYDNENTYSYISKKMGYRFLLENAQISSKTYAGSALHLNLNIKNDGFGNLVNARDFEIILSNGTTSYTAKVNDDPRKWYKENGLMTKDLYFKIPSNIEAGSWNVYLNLPDSSSTIKNRPEYSIRLANSGVWDDITGYNLIKKGLVIETINKAGSSTSFTQISKNEAEGLMNNN